MNYAIYEHVRNASWQFLIDNGISKLPLSLSDICQTYNITIIENSKLTINKLNPSEDGKCFLIDGQWYIVINDDNSAQTIRFAIAHELGHILLGHVYSCTNFGIYTQNYNELRRREEYEADRFAISILSPACVLWALDIHMPKEISNICNIPLDKSKFRARRMETLYHRNMFLSHPLEKRVFFQFKKFIESYKK